MTKLGTLGLVALAVTIVGCSGSSSDPSGGTQTQDGGATTPAATGACKPEFGAALCVKATVTGRVTHTGTTTAALAGTSCAEWMQGKDGRLRFPLFFENLDGAEFGFGSLVTDFKGAGTYPFDSLSGLGQGFTVTSERVFEGAGSSGSTATLTVAANGDGSLEFKDFIEIKDPEPRSPALSGSITWTCVDAK